MRHYITVTILWLLLKVLAWNLKAHIELINSPMNTVAFRIFREE